MSDPQQDASGDQIPPIPLAPGAEVPPVPQVPSAPPVPDTGPDSAAPVADVVPEPVPPVAPEVDTQAPVNPYVQPPTNPYLQNTVNPYVQPMQNPYAPNAEPAAGPFAAQPFGAQPDAAQPFAGQADAGQVFTPAVEPAQPGPYGQPQYPQPQYAQPQQPYAPQQDYAAQPQAYAQPQQASGPSAPPPQYPAGSYGPPGYASPPMGPSRFNVLGLISLITGGVAGLFGLVLSWIPFVGFALVVLALIGVGLGIWGLLVKNKSKGLAIAGTIVSGLALLMTAAISIVMLMVFSAATSYNPYSDYSDYSDSSDAGSPVEVGPDSETAALGDTITLRDYSGEDVWEVVVHTPVLDATDAVLAADEYNSPPAEGSQYVVVPVTLGYLGDGAEDPYAMLVEIVTSGGDVVYSHWAYVPNSLYDVPEIKSGESAEINLVFEVESTDVPGAMLSLRVPISDPVYVPLD